LKRESLGSEELSEDAINRKAMEIALKKSESRYRNIIENTTDVIIVTGFNGKHLYVSPRYKDLFGRSPEQIDRFILDYLHPDDRSSLIPLYQESFRNRYAAAPNQEFEFRILHQNGSYIWVSSITKNYYDEEGKVVGVITSIRDIRKRKETELKLKESEEKFRKIFEANPSGMHLYDLNPDGDLIFRGANYAADRILKIDNNQNIGKTIEEAFPLLVDTDIPNKYRLIASEGKPLNWKYFNYSRDQINGVYEIYAFQTGPGSIVSSFLDITDRIEAEKRLKEMNRLKNELLRRASHELRTPLTSISGAVDLLLTSYNEDFDEKTEQFLYIIKNGVKRLENLITDLLNVSSLQTGNIEIYKLRENIVKLIIDSIDEIKIIATEREIKIIFIQEESIYINVDKNKILQVIVNLLMNAIKYTPPKGEVSIKIEIPTENLIDIIIKDTGIGFTEEEKKIVFKQFGKIERFGQGFDLNTEGSGLGLYISKQLVELHSGELWVDSEGRNRGSSFTIRLPKF